MAEKKSSKDNKTEGKNIEREYVIPLREGFRQKPIYKKTPAAVKTIKKFLVKHMKIRDRNLNKIKINKYLNEYLWFRGIRKPPAKIKIRAVKEDAGTEKEKVRVYLLELPEKLKFKQKREEKLSKKAEEKAEEKKSAKTLKEKISETKKDKTEEESDKKEEKDSESKEEEKKEETQDANIKIAKETQKKQKHITGGKHKDQTAPKRQALKK